MRLYHYVQRTGNVRTWPALFGDNEEVAREALNTIVEMAHESIAVDVNDVYALAGQGGGYKGPQVRSLSGVTSPWPVAWFEYTSDSGHPIAILTLQRAIDDEVLNEFKNIQIPEKTLEGRNYGKQNIPQEGFAHRSHVISRTADEPNAPPVLAGWCHWFSDVEGNPALTTTGRAVMIARTTPHRENAELIGFATRVAVLTCAFANCRNVETIEVLPTRQHRRLAERRGEPIYKHYVLAIDVNTQHKIYPKGQPIPSNKRLHICRGHFATYTEAAPLFGKLTGRFWVPAHVRGKAESGFIDKDYRVKAPIS